MLVVLKNNLMADPERKAAVDNIARVAAEKSAKLKELQAPIRRAISGLDRWAKLIDERDAAIDANLLVVDDTPRKLTAADRRQLARNQARVTRIEGKLSALQSEIYASLAEVRDGSEFITPAFQDLMTGSQQYQFSIQAPAPLPIRSQRVAEVK